MKRWRNPGCTSSCDVAKAKKGEDPHPALHAGNGDARHHGASGPSSTDAPAVILGGVLADTSPRDSIKALDRSPTVDPASWRQRPPLVDLLA